MSGGVDSSVAAALLADEGHDVIGVSMQLYDASAASPDGRASFGSCCSLDDLHDARRVAAALDIPHYILNFERQFNEQVVSNFVREYASGRTPLPCAHCNTDLKFSTLLERARGFGADAVATGHYARLEQSPQGTYRLKRGVDGAKDQSYFLFALTQEQLGRAMFPVGDRPKAAVRDYARRRRLPVADKPDSQEICFIPDHDYATFVTEHSTSPTRGGAIVDQDGRVLGGHDGVHRFTIGQRKGLGLGGTRSPMYVLALKPVARQVVVGPRAALERTLFRASGVNWIAGPPGEARRFAVQIRHRHQAAAATVTPLDHTHAEVAFDMPQTAVTPGQAAVFYDDDEVVGGGWIDND